MVDDSAQEKMSVSDERMNMNVYFKISKSCLDYPLFTFVL